MEPRITSIPLLLTVDDAARLFRSSGAFVYKLIGNGELQSLRIGTKRFVMGESVKKLIERKAAEAFIPLPRVGAMVEGRRTKRREHK